MGGNPITLVGNEVAVGANVSDFSVVDNNLAEKKLSDYGDKIKLISVVPSLDTSVCDLQTKRFNQEAGKLGSDIVILTISMDLPFAQKRWCGAAGVENLETLSDYNKADFGNKFGVLIKELRLLNRSIFILDKNNTVIYQEIVTENTQHPDYDKVLDFLKSM
ncbi:MAG: thiol peroxidase [Spirochaetales bacterium]|nr:thiol peroxidase [Spirochaetales bacterium]